MVDRLPYSPENPADLENSLSMRETENSFSETEKENINGLKEQGAPVHECNRK